MLHAVAPQQPPPLPHPLAANLPHAPARQQNTRTSAHPRGNVIEKTHPLYVPAAQRRPPSQALSDARQHRRDCAAADVLGLFPPARQRAAHPQHIVHAARAVAEHLERARRRRGVARNQRRLAAADDEQAHVCRGQLVRLDRRRERGEVAVVRARCFQLWFWRGGGAGDVLLAVAAVEMADEDDQRALCAAVFVCVAEAGEGAGFPVGANDEQRGGLRECCIGRERVCGGGCWGHGVVWCLVVQCCVVLWEEFRTRCDCWTSAG